MRNYNKRNIIISTILLIAMIVCLSAFTAEVRLERDVEAYLMNEREYSKADIKEMQASFRVAPLIGVEVHFADEPGARYFYKKENDRIMQHDATPPEHIDSGETYPYKHLESITEEIDS